MAAAGFANTLCSNADQLSLKQVARWLRFWSAEGEGESDFRLRETYACLLDHLARGLVVHLGSAVRKIRIEASGGVSLEVIDTEVAQPGQQPDAVLAPGSGKGGGSSAADNSGRAGGALRTLRARTVVVTASPHVLRTELLAFQPPLPAAKRDALWQVHMHRAVKVLLKFSSKPWPQRLAGMIVADQDLPLPEVCFQDVDASLDNQTVRHDDCDADTGAEQGAEQGAVCFAVGFATAGYANRLLALGDEQQILAR